MKPHPETVIQGIDMFEHVLGSTSNEFEYLLYGSTLRTEVQRGFKVLV
jgi:hypothetical protein